jgi:hypothetical protein
MKHSWKYTAGVIALASAFIIPAFAGGRGGGPMGGPGRPGDRGGWWRGLTGTVSSVNASGNSLSVTANVGHATPPVTLSVPATVPILRYSSVGIAGLKVGDSIRVSGLPLTLQATAIDASSVVSTSTTSGTTGTTTTGSATSSTAGGPNLRDDGPGPRSGASAVGTVQSVDTTNSKVVVTLADGTAVTVNVPADLQITRQDQVTLADVQAGDLLQARVTSDSSGNLTAITLELKAAAATVTTGTPTSSTTGTSG